MTSRRTFVASGLAVLGALAGCVGIDDDDDVSGRENGDPENGDDDPVPDVAPYTEWIPAEIGTDDWYVGVYRPAALVPHDEHISPVTEPLNLDPETVELVLVYGSGSLDDSDTLAVFAGDFEADPVVEAFESQAPEEPSEQESYRGYDVYATADELLAVRDGIALAPPSREATELGIDAIEDDQESLVETDDRLARFEQERTAGEVVVVETREAYEGALLGLGYDLTAEGATVSVVVTGEATDTMTDIADAFEAESFEDPDGFALTDVTIDTSDTVVTLAGNRPNQAGAGRPAPERATDLFDSFDRLVRETLGDFDHIAPRVAYEYDYDADEQELTIFTAAGDAVEAGTLSFEGEGFDGTGTTWAEQTELEPTDEVFAGDRATLTGVAADFEVDVVWTGDGDQRVVISTRRGPDA